MSKTSERGHSKALNDGEKFALWEWMKNNREQLEGRKVSEIHQLAIRSMSFAVTESNVRTGLKVCDIKPKHVASGGGTVAVVNKKIEDLTEVVQGLMQEVETLKVDVASLKNLRRVS